MTETAIQTPDAEVKTKAENQDNRLFKPSETLPSDPIESDIDDIADEEGAPAWMVTFADLVTLLLVFFILLFSISSVETEKFKSVLSSIQLALNDKHPIAQHIIIETVSSTTEADSNPIIPQPIAEPKKPSDKEQLLDDIESMILEQRLGKFVYVYSEGDHIIIRIKGTILFPSGDVVLFDDAVPIFEDIYYLFKKYADYNIDIKGYTDNSPIATKQFPSNWELSAVRATTVLRFFIDQGIDPTRMSATGYADLFPIASNTTEAGRAQNRRVEFVLEKQE